MVDVLEDTKGKIRNLPIVPELRTLLSNAGAIAGVDRVRVTSGGQAAKGSGGPRTGSTRHDNGRAADLMLEKDGRALSFQRPDELAIFESFVTAAAAMGATGIGAGVNYMGPFTIHVGYGSEACWGDGGKIATAPAWLRKAFTEGRNQFRHKQMPVPVAVPLADADRGKLCIVNARSGLRLRNGPGTNFDVATVLAADTRVYTHKDDAHPEWLQVDIEGDGRLDGYAYAAFLKAV